MHEFSLAHNVVSKLKVALKKELLEEKKVLVRISVGELLYSDNLEFWVHDIAKKELGPRIRIKLIIEKSDIHCGKCGYSGKANPMGDHHLILCPKCSSNRISIKSGNKIFVINVEVARKQYSTDSSTDDVPLNPDRKLGALR